MQSIPEYMSMTSAFCVIYVEDFYYKICLENAKPANLKQSLKITVHHFKAVRLILKSTYFIINNYFVL